MGQASVEVRPETRRSRCQVGRRGRRGRANPRPAKDLVVVNRSRSIAFGWCMPEASCTSWPSLGKAPIAAEAVRRIDRLFAIERDVARPERRGDGWRYDESGRRRSWPTSSPGCGSSRTGSRASRRSARRSPTRPGAGKRSPGSWATAGSVSANNAAERALRGVAVGRRNWTFAGSDRGGERAAAIYTLIETAKLNGIDPQAWLADVLARLPDHPGQADRRVPAMELGCPSHGRCGSLSAAVKSSRPRPSADGYGRVNCASATAKARRISSATLAWW